MTGATLSRFFGVHVLVLPLSLAALLVIHLAIVHQQGLADPTRPEPRDPAEVEEIRRTEKLKPFFPDYILDEVIAWYAILAVLVILATVFPAGLEDKANPIETPAHIKPEWYFLAVYELLKFVPRIVGILAPIVAFGVLAQLPFLDRDPAVRPRKRPVALAIGFVAITAMVVLTVMGLS